jgi:hypothetical protein
MNNLVYHTKSTQATELHYVCSLQCNITTFCTCMHWVGIAGGVLPDLASQVSLTTKQEYKKRTNEYIKLLCVYD